MHIVNFLKNLILQRLWTKHQYPSEVRTELTAEFEVVKRIETDEMPSLKIWVLFAEEYFLFTSHILLEPHDMLGLKLGKGLVVGP